MRRCAFNVVFGALAALIAVSCATTRSDTLASSSQLAKLDALFSKWNREDSPGCAIGVQRLGAPVLFRAYGRADLEHEVTIDATTVFEAGSVSKQFTAASVLILVEQGKIALDDDVRKYIPELPDYGAPITIAQLFGHTSGLRDWEGVVDIAGWPVTSRAYTEKDVLEIITRQDALNHPPGSEFSYTNSGYILLAIIVERVSGESFAQFSTEHLFEPLGMTHTQWRDNFQRIVKGRAVAYDADSHGYGQLMPFENVIGAGGLLTTVDDLLRWNAALTAQTLGRFVTAELQRVSTLSDGRATAYARGLYVGQYHNVRKLSHTGETAGYEAFLARYPSQNLSVALLCNAGSEVNIDALGDQVADLFLEHPSTPPTEAPASAEYALSAEQLKPFAGLYFDPHLSMQLQLDVNDKGQLRRVSDGLVFAPVSPGVFRTAISTIHFSGTDRFVRAFDDGRKWDFHRVTPWHPDSAELAEFVGRYRSDEANATYELNVRAGRISIALDDRRWDTTELDPVDIDTFMKSHHSYRFVRNANGAITGLEISNGWEHVYALLFRRLKNPSE